MVTLNKVYSTRAYASLQVRTWFVPTMPGGVVQEGDRQRSDLYGARREAFWDNLLSRRDNGAAPRAHYWHKPPNYHAVCHRVSLKIWHMDWCQPIINSVLSVWWVLALHYLAVQKFMNTFNGIVHHYRPHVPYVYLIASFKFWSLWNSSMFCSVTTCIRTSSAWTCISHIFNGGGSAHSLWPCKAPGASTSRGRTSRGWLQRTATRC